MRRSIVILLAATLLGSRAPAQPSTVILVRHAEKASQTESDPILSEAGTQRARELALALADAHVTTVITTQLLRTKLTGAPVVEAGEAAARSCGRISCTSVGTMVVANSGNTAAHVAEVAAAVKAQPAGGVVLVVGHSNTIPAIVGALGGPKMPNLCDSQYSVMFILEMSGSSPPRLVRATYGTADPADPSCPKAMKQP